MHYKRSIVRFIFVLMKVSVPNLENISTCLWLFENQINTVYLNRLYRNVYLKQHIYYRKRVYIEYF